MSDETLANSEPIVCDDCDAQVILVATEKPSHELRCDCELRSVDVSDIVGHSSLFDPFGGSWDNVDDE